MDIPDGIDVDPGGLREAAATGAAARTMLVPSTAILTVGPGRTMSAAGRAGSGWLGYLDDLGGQLELFSDGLRKAAADYLRCDADAQSRLCATAQRP